MHNNEKKFKYSSSIQFNTLAMFILITINLQAVFFSAFNIIDDGFLIFGLIIVFILGIVIPIIKKTFKLKRSIFLFIGYIFILFLFSFLKSELYSFTLNILINFITFGLLGLLIGSNKVDCKLLLEYISYILIATIIIIPYIFSNYSIYGDYLRLEMGISYAILPVCLGNLIHFVYFRKNSTLIIKVSYIVNSLFMFFIVFYGTRGVIFSILITLFFILTNKVKNNEIIISKIKMLLFFGIAILLFLNFTNILKLTYELLSTLDIKISFIEKTILLLNSEQDIFNNRLDIYNTAWKGFLSSPIIGNGIGSFTYYTNEVYAHNIFLDMLFETGIILLLPITTLLIFSTVKELFSANLKKEKYALFLFLFMVCIPRLMFSASLWSTQSFWLLLGLSISNLSIKRVK